MNPCFPVRHFSARATSESIPEPEKDTIVRQAFRRHHGKRKSILPSCRRRKPPRLIHESGRLLYRLRRQAATHQERLHVRRPRKNNERRTFRRLLSDLKPFFSSRCPADRRLLQPKTASENAFRSPPRRRLGTFPKRAFRSVGKPPANRSFGFERRLPPLSAVEILKFRSARSEGEAA